MTDSRGPDDRRMASGARQLNFVEARVAVGRPRVRRPPDGNACTSFASAASDSHTQQVDWSIACGRTCAGRRSTGG
jgi:hypothetical protein